VGTTQQRIGNPVPTSPWAAGSATQKSQALRRAANQLTLLLVLATVAVIAVAWLEPIARVFESRQPPGARRGIAQSMRARGWAVGSGVPVGHPRIRGGALDPGNSGRAAPERNRLFELLEPDDPIHGNPSGSRGKVLAKKSLKLRDRAADDADLVTSVSAGSRVRIVRDLGEWLLVASDRDGKASFGWVRREELLPIGR
jgi:uncharacterized protein YgiM (DUF1202 family)